MTIEDVQYGEFELASVDVRSDNFWYDFAFSSGLSVPVLYFFWDQFWMAFALFLLIKFLYYFIFEYFYGQTAGKMVSNTKVISKDGSRPSAGQIIKRTFARSLALGNFPSDDRFAIHDKTSDTIVVVDQTTIKLKEQRIRAFLTSAIFVPFLLLSYVRDIPEWVNFGLLAVAMLVFTIYLLLKLHYYAKNHRL